VGQFLHDAPRRRVRRRARAPRHAQNHGDGVAAAPVVLDPRFADRFDPAQFEAMVGR
jgi:hypothetical protein